VPLKQASRLVRAARLCALLALATLIALLTLTGARLANASQESQLERADLESRGIIIIDQAQALLTVANTSELNFVALPYHWDRQHSGQSGEASFEVAFELPGEPAEPYAVYLPHVGSRADIWLNGSLLSQLGDYRATSGSNYAHAPRYYTVPPQVLQKTNLIRIHLRADSGRRAGLSTVMVGRQSALTQHYEAQWSTQVTSRQMVALLLLTVAILSASLAMTQPALRHQFGLTAAASALWALHIGAPLVEAAWFNAAVPAQAAAAVGWLAVLTTAYMLYRLLGTPQRWAARLGIALLVLMAYQLWTQGSADYWTDGRWVVRAAALLAVVILVQVVQLFRAASAQARDLLLTLEQRVADKEAELAGSYQQLALLATAEARSTERTRILRDMHDGVGSHISAAMRQLQSGQATSSEVLTTLRDSLDQLKLSIDAMHLPTGDVGALLANMRYRLEPRFTSSGMVFEWDVDALPPIDRLDHSALRQLQYMLFEALSNALQHAKAHTLRIEARATGSESLSPGARLRIIDDGQGFDANAPVSRGLASMRERANAIAARLQISSAAGRTVVEIDL
jgi:signal transduction histidine kinase